MMALLFALWLGVAYCVMSGRSSAALWGGYGVLLAAMLWFLHHASDPLAILL